MSWRSMTKQKKIIQRQNEETSLKYQYCARVYFNAASAQNIISWLCCLAAAASVALPLRPPWLAVLIPVILDFIYWLSSNRVASLVSTAARLRNDFDDYVLGFKSTISSDDFTFESLEKIIKKERYQKQFIIQEENSSRDTPPGIKDWYEFHVNYSDNDAVFSCQRQNATWNNILMHQRLIAKAIVFIAIAAISFIYIVKTQIGLVDLLRLVCGVAGTIQNIIDKSRNEYKYIKVSHKIDGAIYVMKEHRLANQLQLLQGLLGSRRFIPVLESNFLHKIQSKQISIDIENREKSFKK